MNQPITVLCTAPKSNYLRIPDLDLYDLARDAYTFAGSNPVIAHPPCAQWSRMKAFSKPDARSKALGGYCFEFIKQNGGILEHPAGSSLFKYLGVKPTLSINQSWFGFPCRKTTYLYFHGYEPLSFPLDFTLPGRDVSSLHSADRSIMPLAFCQYLVDCIKHHS